MRQLLLRQLPKIDELLMTEFVGLHGAHLSHQAKVECLREAVDVIRRSILMGECDHLNQLTDEHIYPILGELLKKGSLPNLKPVINGTGIILHTNLGRSLLPKSVAAKMLEVATRYSNLEFQLETGERGSRYEHVEDRICALTGAEAAMVVNNNAAAVLLVLDTLAKQKEVIISRGQLVEIGGSFRIPDVMSRSQSILKEVGTTNKTHLKDYEEAVTENTAALMKVHTSNFKMIGFVESVPLEQLVALGQEKGLPVIDDLGSGSLVDLTQFGLCYEPTVMDGIVAGADVVTFSGDKLLGGPQAGIICGKKDIISAIKRNPLTRALRVDKMTFSALEGLLMLYTQGGEALQEIPTIKMMSQTKDVIKERTEKFKRQLVALMDENMTSQLYDVFMKTSYSEMGGGSLPGEQLETYVIGFQPKVVSVSKIAQRLRMLETPVIGRIHEDIFWIDLRTVMDEEEESLLKCLAEVLMNQEAH